MRKMIQCLRRIIFGEVMFMSLFKNSLITAIILVAAACVFAGCGSDNDLIGNAFGGDGCDAVFCIMEDTAVSPFDKDLLRLIRINDREYESANELEFSVSGDESAISLTGDDGIIKAAASDTNRTALLTAKSLEGSFTVKIVVFSETDPLLFISDGNLLIPYGVSEVGTAFSGQEIKYARVPSTMRTIGENAFSNCSKLERVDLPELLTGIEPRAFENCSALLEIEIPDGVKVIKNSAFRHCKSLKNISFSKGLSDIEPFAFYGCSKLERVELPASLSSIGSNAFQSCTSLETVTIPEGISRIEDWSFADCSSLSTVNLPHSLREIGARAFMQCNSIEKLVIPSEVKKLGTDVFNGCTGISELHIPACIEIEKGFFSGVTHLREVHLTGTGKGANYTNTNYIYTPWYLSRNNNIKAVIEEGVESVGDYTFVRCTGLYEVVFPDSLKNILHGAFRKCSNLETVSFPENLRQIDDYAFSLCKKLKNVAFSDRLAVIGVSAFAYDTEIEELKLPDSVLYVGPLAFGCCNSLKSIELGTSSESNLKVIGEKAFCGFLFDCKEVTVYSEKLTAVGSAAFGFYLNCFGQNYYARLAEGSVIRVANNARSLFSADYNYHGNTCEIVTITKQ